MRYSTVTWNCKQFIMHNAQFIIGRMRSYDGIVFNSFYFYNFFNF